MTLTPTTIRIENSTNYADPSGAFAFAADGSGYLATQCRRCLSDGGDAVEFESLGYWVELDGPLHCDDCEALIVTALTNEGRDEVRQALTHADGRNEVLAAWSVGFAGYLEDASHCEACGFEHPGRAHSRD